MTPISASSRVDFRSVGKSFSQIPVLHSVSFSVAPGSIHALMGENGAGKSTLVKILCGALTADTGEVLLDGSPLPAGDVMAAARRGVAFIPQEVSVMDDLPAWENLFLAREARLARFVADHAAMRRRARELADQLELGFDLELPAGRLSTAQKQLLAIGRAMVADSRVLILDEPTAALSRRETEVLFRILRERRDAGASLIYISHRMEEIFALADRVTVLRDGRHVRTAPAGELDSRALVSLMVGRELAPDAVAPRQNDGPVALEVRALSHAHAFQDVALKVRRGELVCLTGLVGAGRSELVNAIFGLEPTIRGSVEVEGRAIRMADPTASIAAGLALVPEERAREGLVLPMGIQENLILPGLSRLRGLGMRHTPAERADAASLIRSLAIKARSALAPVASLSGGNQQKVAIGKWLVATPKVLLLDEPTRGVDVGAKAEIYAILRGLAEQGMAALIVSSDLPEVLALADRILVMRQGRLSGELSRDEATQEKILALALPMAAQPAPSTAP